MEGTAKSYCNLTIYPTITQIQHIAAIRSNLFAFKCYINNNGLKIVSACSGSVESGYWTPKRMVCILEYELNNCVQFVLYKV